MKARRNIDNNSDRNVQPEKTRGSVYGLRNVDLTMSTRGVNFVYPVKERIKYFLNNNIPDSDELNVDLLYYLKQSTWCLHRVSPIHNVDYSEVSLKKYAAKIKQALSRHYNDTDNDLSFIAKVIAVETTEQKNEKYKTLQIEVIQNASNRPSQIKYKGLLLNWNSYNERNGVSLPLLLCSGTVGMKRIVNNTLQQIFNNYISSFEITSTDMYWLCALSGFSSRRKHFSYLCYQLPHSKDSFQIELQTATLERLWSRSHREDSAEMTYQEIDSLQSGLAEELHDYLDIDFSKMCLHKVVLPVITLQAVGKIKFHDEDHIGKVMLFLQDMAEIATVIL